jgi:hypothetical protein
MVFGATSLSPDSAPPLSDVSHSHDAELLGLDEVELLLNAAHLSEPLPQTASPVDESSRLSSDEVAPSGRLSSDEVAPVETTSPIVQESGQASSGEVALSGRLSSDEVAPVETTQNLEATVETLGLSREATVETTSPAAETTAPISIPKPGPKPPTPAQFAAHQAEVSVVTETLNRMFRPTPRDVSSNIGRPTERPLRPTYSTGPDQPKPGTWASQWSQVIDSVVGRVLSSLTKSTTVDTWNVISLGRPSIPQEIDKALLLDATEAMGVYTLSDAERHEVRASFWREFDQVDR